MAFTRIQPNPNWVSLGADEKRKEFTRLAKAANTRMREYEKEGLTWTAEYHQMQELAEGTKQFVQGKQRKTDKARYNERTKGLSELQLTQMYPRLVRSLMYYDSKKERKEKAKVAADLMRNRLDDKVYGANQLTNTELNDILQLWGNAKAVRNIRMYLTSEEEIALTLEAKENGIKNAHDFVIDCVDEWIKLNRSGPWLYGEKIGITSIVIYITRRINGMEDYS